MTKNTQPVEREFVGRKYERTVYKIVHRQAGKGGSWYGMSQFNSEAEGRKELQKQLGTNGRYFDVGGITLDFGPDDGTRYERKLVKVIQHCEVLAIGIGR